MAKFSHTALTVLERRYLRRDEIGNTVESPDEMFRRVAETIGKTDEEVEIFYRMMDNLVFLPNTPTLMNAGLPSKGCLSACFVIPIYDSMESILDGVKHAALICKAGGGVGYSFSRLRPSNDVVSSTSGIASGPVSFMHIYDTATEVIKQGGRRRGANMGVLHCEHPDIEDFISCKSNPNNLNNFNISVALTDEFMAAVEEDNSYSLRNPRTGEAVKHVQARAIFAKIVENGWASGEPGVIFIDTINKHHPSFLGKIEATNPCGEQPLLPYESCNLGSINLSRFVENGHVNYPTLQQVVHDAVLFLDRVIDANHYPLVEIEAATKQTRKIGLGIMGWADMLIQLGIPYNSRKALNLAEKVMDFINQQAYLASVVLAEKMGAAPCFASHGLTAHENGGVRNVTRTTIAPTGSISIIAGCSSGIEPLFGLAFKRTVMDKDEFIEVNPEITRIVKPSLSDYRWGKFRDELLESGRLNEDMIERFDLKEILRPEVFATSHDISPEWHIKMQAAFQKYVDNAVSKTINLPADATPKSLDRCYVAAWKMGIKGLTVYRDGSREGQVLSTTPRNSVEPKGRPETVSGMTTKTITGCGEMYITQNYDAEGLFEVFGQMGKAGGCEQANAQAIGRLISLCLRGGVKIDSVIKQLAGIRCHTPCFSHGNQILSCADAIAQVLAKQAHVAIKIEGKPMSCPDCSMILQREEGCLKCGNCGFSKCG